MMDTLTVTLAGADGNQPLGFLAAIGALRVLTDQAPQLHPRLAWDYDRHDRPVLHLSNVPEGHDPQALVLSELDRYAENLCNDAADVFDHTPTSALPSGGKGQVPAWPEVTGTDWFHAVHHWCPWLTPAWNKDKPAFRMALWAKNCGGQQPLHPIKTAQAAASLLTHPAPHHPNPVPAAARWHDLLSSGLQPPSRWQETFYEHTDIRLRSSATKDFTAGYAMWWLAPAVDPGKRGIEGSEFGDKPSNPSTKVKTLCAPGHALLALPGLGSIPAHKAQMPGQDRAQRTDRTMRWTLWRQPLALPAATTLQWHPALDDPHNLATRRLCGDYPAPVRAATLHENAGTTPTPPPVRTRR